jgi:uncharacterized Zn finger protein (UPF0148 family)
MTYLFEEEEEPVEEEAAEEAEEVEEEPEPVKKPAAKPAPAAKQVAGKKPELNQFLDEIKKRAFAIYQERQKTKAAGDQLSDWLKAEKEIKTKYKL